jgi:hypothetical protein
LDFGNATFYLLRNPDILRRMREEIKTVMLDGTIDGVSVLELEALPYLVSVSRKGWDALLIG